MTGTLSGDISGAVDMSVAVISVLGLFLSGYLMQ